MTGEGAPGPLELHCPACRVALTPADGHLDCPACRRRATVDPVRRRFDFAPFLEESSTSEHRKVGLAYRFYSLAYAPLALLNMWFVWHARLRDLIEHYRSALSNAQGEVLDVAVGDGALTRLVLRGIDRTLPILGLDISDEMLVRAERALRSFRGYRFARADGCALPLSSDCLETVCCFGGLHVIAHPERAMREMARVLRPGGLFFASILTRPGGSIGRYLSRRYVELGFLSTDFTQDQAQSLLVDAGLTVSGWRLNGTMVLASARKP